MTWEIFGFIWLWVWGFMLALAAVQEQKNKRPRGGRVLNGWDWLVCAFWPIASPVAIIAIIWESRHG